MGTLIQISHPLLTHSLTILRDRTTGTGVFRQHARIVSQVLMVEATRTLALAPRRVETPLAPFEGAGLDGRVVVVPVLRAGLAMLMAVEALLPDVRVGFVGLERDEATAVAREYYQKIPALTTDHRVLVLDPMLATGGSLDDTVVILHEKGCRGITLVCIVAAPEGIARIHGRYPDTTIITAAVDRELNAHKFIVPGLGDFGDRYFGT